MSLSRSCIVALLFFTSAVLSMGCDGSVYEDPHIRGFFGRRVEFNGLPNNVYHVYSDPYVLVNALFANASNSKPDATLLTHVYIKIADGQIEVATTPGQNTVYVTNAGSSQVVIPNGVGTSHSFASSCENFYYDGSSLVTLTTPTLRIQVSFHPSDGNWFGVPYLNLNVTHAYESESLLGGFLGFTASTTDRIKFTHAQQASYVASSSYACDSSANCLYTASAIDCSTHVVRSVARSASFEARSVSGAPTGQQQANWNVDSDFETPNTGDYIYNPAGSPYTFSGSAGIARNGAFASYGSDGQYAFVQVGGSFTRQYYFSKRSNIEIMWTDAGRSGSSGFDGNASYNVTVTSDAGGVVLSASRSVANAQRFTQQSEVFYVNCEGSYTVKFVNTIPVQDHTALIDNLMVMVSTRGKAHAIGNGGFESPDQSGGFNYVNHGGGTTGGNLGYFAAAPWLLLGDGSALSGGQGFSYAGVGSTDGQYYVLQTSNNNLFPSRASQTLTLNATGTYTIAYSVAARFTAQTVMYSVVVRDQLGAVFLNSAQVAASTTFVPLTVDVTVSSSIYPSIYTFDFVITEPNTNDRTLYLDDVSVTNK